MQYCISKLDLFNGGKFIISRSIVFNNFVDTEPGKWIQTSYNTRHGVHALGGTPLRKNYAGIGYTYDKERDAFIPPKCEESWTLNESTCQWECPLPYPTDGKSYTWDDAAYKADNTKGWVLESVQEE